MPNHCAHVLTALGDPEVIQELVDAVRVDGEHFSFQGILPAPSCVFRGNLGQAEEQRYPGRNWYDHNCRRWGTKWGAYSAAEPERWAAGDKAGVLFRFETAWSFPEPVLRELAVLFPDVSFHVRAIDEGFLWAKDGEFRGDHWGVADVDCDQDGPAFRELFWLVYGESIEDRLSDDEDATEESA